MALMLVAAVIPAASYGAETAQNDDIVILFSSDVHGKADENLGYAGLVAYANEMRSASKYVSVIDAGDAVSGSLLSAVSEGMYSVETMNLAGYTAAVPGVHDFDYGVNRLGTDLMKAADYPYISCNFVMTASGQPVFQPYRMVSYGDKKVAYIGISDPQTVSKSNVNFGGSFGFCDGNQGADLYRQVQETIDEALLDGADYIIAAAHLNSDPFSPYSASAVIGNTVGIHAMIQGSTHAASAGTKVRDAAGNTVLLTCAGSGLENIGVLTIKSNQTMEAKLIADYKLRDVKTRDAIETMQTSYNSQLAKNFAVTSTRLEAAASGGSRTIDKRETNLGDLVADAYREAGKADIALVESGEIQASLAVGDITYKNVMKVLPEGKSLCVAEVSGADIMDALEMSARLYPNANSGFFQVSGLTYDIQETVIPSVSLDGFGRFGGVSGEYRVTNIMIGGKALDLFGTYTVAGTKELLSGDTGYTMFRNGVITDPDVSVDHLAVITYLKDTLKGSVGGHYAKSQGRIDSIRLARLSELEAEVGEMVKDELKEYEDRIAALEKQLKQKTEILAIKDMEITASSTFGKSSGKRYIKVTWKVSEKVDGLKYQVYKSSKKSSGYSKAKSTSSLSYKNTSGLTKGKTYYYKVRGYKSIGGKTYYTEWSNKTSKKVTK